MSNPPSVLTEEDLSSIRGRYEFPKEVQVHLPFPNERADTVSEGWLFFLGLIVIAEEAGVELSVDDILALYYPQENSKERGRYSMYPRRKKQVVGEMKNVDRYWQNRYFFMLVNEKSLGALANAFFPLWGYLSKELKKPPSKALLFEQKLEQLLAQPCHEWDEINVSERLRASSLWKDFVELKTESVLDTMNIYFPNLKDLLVKTKAQKEAAKAAATEKPAQANRTTEPLPMPVIESSPEPPTMFAQSPAKKRKADEKPTRKIPTKKKKMSKASTSETDVELRSSKQGAKNIEVDLPPGMCLLQNRSIGAGIM
ncbi:hypothetical protein TIFTF001_014285 [Ficus carica]|uniref:Uncharacterized protein n=1 Tax=Ficus carica TaxID=3494 RepID=A0AA88AFS4_FICCA|nr:hypothetical protein TIFTF001_014285 [Ficus carica]